LADVGYIAIVVAGFGAYWWRHVRPMWTRPPDPLAADADVAVHVAQHEAVARGQALSSVHVLYGLLQDDTVIAAIRTAGGDPDALEDRVLDALAGDAARPVHHESPDDGHWRIGRAVAIARRAERQVGCTDLWAILADSPAAELLEAARLDRGAVLFVLFHGGAAPELPAAEHRDVFVVLRNDHYTTQEFVCSVLRDVFALSDVQAQALMLATHSHGRAVIGRFTAAAARAKIADARTRARAHAFPLWLGVEPA
jgi:ATP-dependent Clp protease adaptor protein ClpS